MRYLYIDTSSSFLYSGIVENDKLVATVTEEMDNDLSLYRYIIRLFI